MPQVIANVVFYISYAVAYAAAVYPGLTMFAVTTLLSTVSSKLFGPKLPGGPGLQSRQVMSRSAIDYRKVVYGQAMVSGPIYYNNISGTNREYLWYGIALAQGESEDLISVWFDRDEIPKADIAWTAGLTGSGTGNVSTARWVGENSTPGAQIFYYLGEDNQNSPTALDTAFSDWSTNHRLRGVTHLICQLRYDEDTEEVWKNGPPQNIRAVIKGRKIYDPRLDSTQTGLSPVGSGTHRYNDATTWAWSENPSLCVADYLVNIMGVDPATSIDWQSVLDTAEDCETQVVVPPSASPENTEDRFTCNGALSLGQTHKSNLDAILSSMDGKLSYSGGVWKVRASVWEASSVTITENDLAGPVEVRGSAPESERFNKIRGFFLDPARDHELVEFPHVIDSAYLTRDNNKVLSYDLELPMTNSVTMAQRIAFRILEQSDNQIIATIKMNLTGSKVAIGDVVSLTVDSLGWAAKTFRCIQWARNADSSFNLVLREDFSASYTDPLVGDYSTTNTGGVTIPTTVIPDPANLVASTTLNGVTLSWTDPPLGTYSHIQVWVSDDNDRTNAELLAITPSSPYVDNASNIQRSRYYWVRAVGSDQEVSNYNPNTTTTTAVAYPTNQELHIVADPFIRLGSSYWEGTGHSYVTTAGLDSTDVIRIQATSTARNFLADARRGPREWDMQSPGTYSVEIRWRWSLQTDPGGSWTQGVVPFVRVSDENETNAVNFNGGTSTTTFSNGDTTGVWKDDSIIVEVADTGTPPRFFQVGITVGINVNGPTFDFDFLDARVIGQPFAGADKPGLVPDPVTEAGTYLKDDGTWDTPTATETNDLTAAVTWANVPNANITQGSVTQHQAALTIAETQITDGSVLARVGSAESISADWNWQDNKIERPEIDDYSVTSTTATVSANAVTCTYSTAQSYAVDLEAATGNVTITVSGGPPSGTYGEMIIRVQQDSTADRTLTWAGGTFVWPDATEVEPQAGSDAITIYYLSTWDTGTTWYINGVEYG